MDKIWQKFLTSEYTQTEKQQIELIWLKVTYLDSILVFEETQCLYRYLALQLAVLSFKMLVQPDQTMGMEINLSKSFNCSIL